MYSELVYFEGAHFAHIVDHAEHVRLRRIMAKANAAHSRRRSSPYAPGYFRSVVRQAAPGHCCAG